MSNMVRDTWKKQKRDAKGHFLPIKKEIQKEQQEKHYTLKDIERAFMDGLSNQGGFYPPSKKWEFYKRDKGFK